MDGWMDGWTFKIQQKTVENGPAECSFMHHPQHSPSLEISQSLQGSRYKRPMALSSTQTSTANRDLEDSPNGCLWHTCNMGVFEQEQEAIAECGAAGLGASKEERHHGHHEVLVMELCVLVGLLLVPDEREKRGSGVPGALQGEAHTSWELSLCLTLYGSHDISQSLIILLDLCLFCLLSLLCSLVV